MKISGFFNNNIKLLEIIGIIFDLLGLILISWFLFVAEPIHIDYKETFYGIIGDYRPIVDTINKLSININLINKNVDWIFNFSDKQYCKNYNFNF
jgi:hypothetical protein